MVRRGPVRRDSNYFYLDFCNDSKPHPKTGIDNGAGSRSKIAHHLGTKQPRTC